jgi:peptidase M28-like protein
MPRQATQQPTGDAAELAALREVVEALAPLERRAGSEAEHQAAVWIAERLTAAGARSRVEDEWFRDGYARLLMPLGLAGAAAGAIALAGRARRRSALVAAVAAAGIVDDVSNGPRVWRRLVTRPKRTWNVIAEAGDLAAPRTLVVLAHHDAAPTGLIFDQRPQRWMAARFPKAVERTDTSAPLWWLAAGAPALVALGAAARRRGPLAAGLALSVSNSLLAVDIARSPIVPGANDNLSAVAAIVGLAERLRERPVAGLRVLLVSCGAEEVLQGGIHGFTARHLRHLDPRRTWVLNLDTIGSPELILVEGEGPFVMEDYREPGFRDRVTRAAAQVGPPLRRGVRSRASSDAVIPSRAGYPTAMLASWEPRTKTLSNYHLMTDTPDRLHYDTVVHAVEVVEALARDLAATG